MQQLQIIGHTAAQSFSQKGDGAVRLITTTATVHLLSQGQPEIKDPF